ncbi:MAG: NAD-dependent epimerase/dehydratase family protein [Deltaproteobacteria bacterium]|nr:NAD-dependent epimerase/dehydratase family protein [Deltaproteobacteria bacterium]MBN2673111.1 NAD-dependent epimerase/dehydratase family protein [Deltaproteobacteria bacterium]
MLYNKNILITGGAGFIGTKLIEQLIEHNKITVLDILHRDALTHTPLMAHPNLTFIKGDVRDSATVKEAAQHRTHIIHLASIAGVDTVMNNPVLTMEVTIKGTFNILEAAEQVTTLERFVDISTSEVFGSYAFRVNEQDVTSLGAVGHARWTYAVSKLATEHLAHVMYQQRNVPAVTIRPFNIFGPGQVGEGAIHHFVVKALKNDPIQVHNDGDQIRAWCYIDDFVDGLLRTLSNDNAVGRAFNIGNPRTALTVHNLAVLIVKLANSESRIEHIEWPYTDVELRIPDISAAKSVLNYHPHFDLEEGLLRTIDWYRQKLQS